MREFLILTIDWLGQRPFVGTIMSGSGFLTGTIMTDTLDVIAKLFQIGAFGVAILTGILTAIGWFEKRRKERNDHSKKVL